MCALLCCADKINEAVAPQRMRVWGFWGVGVGQGASGHERENRHMIIEVGMTVMLARYARVRSRSCRTRG